MEISEHKFLGIPPAKPRVWIDLSSAASKRAGLAMHSPGRKALRWAVKVLGWFAWLPIEKIIRGPIKRFEELDGSEIIEKAMDDLAAKDAKIAKKIEWMTLYMGNDSAKTKLTVMVRLSGGVGEWRSGGVDELIVKLGRTDEAAGAIKNEVMILKRLGNTKLAGQVPRVIGDVGHDGIWTWSAQSVLPKTKSPVILQKEHYAFLEELRRIGISHGDFAPWNCSIVGGKLYVWDWEDAGLWVEGMDEVWFKKQVKELLGV